MYTMDIFTKKYDELIAKFNKTTKKHLVKEQANDQVEKAFTDNGYKYGETLEGFVTVRILQRLHERRPHH